MQAKLPANIKNRLSCVIIGGGLAGLVSALLLNRSGFSVTVVEKKQYPFHRVCGEYISNEVLPFFQSLGISLDRLNPAKIQNLAISSVSGRVFKSNLDLGGTGLSRYKLDHYLFEQAVAEGVKFILRKKVNSTSYDDNQFECLLDDNSSITANFVVAAHGKRSNLDRHRDFFYRRSPYIGVKYHIRTDFAKDLIQLDNFRNGYCGTVKIEDDKFCLCYLSHTENLKNSGSIAEMEQNILYENPFLKYIFSNSEFLYDKPEVINEISFRKKTLVEDHIFYCGDSAGMISPLCGNGMAMAVHSAKILTDILINHHQQGRDATERLYVQGWNRHFNQRLKVGRVAQKLFGSKAISELAVTGLNNIKPLSNLIIRNTHGVPF